MSAYENCITLRQNHVPHKQTKKSEGEMTRDRKKASEIEAKRNDISRRDIRERLLFSSVRMDHRFLFLARFFSRPCSPYYYPNGLSETEEALSSLRRRTFGRNFLSVSFFHFTATSFRIRYIDFRWNNARHWFSADVVSLYRWLSDRPRSSSDILTFLIKTKNRKKNSLLIFLDHLDKVG